MGKVRQFYLLECMKKPLLHSIFIVIFFFFYIKLLLLLYTALLKHDVHEKDFLIGIKVIGLFLLLLYAKKSKIVILTKFSLKSIPFIIPLILFEYFSFSGIPADHSVYFSKSSFSILINVLLEEIMFRGIILFIFINFFITRTEKFIIYSCLLGAVVFGFSHLLNFFSTEIHSSPRSIINQVYATTAIGFLLNLIYLKTKNLIFIVLFHFSHNFLTSLEKIPASADPAFSESNRNYVEIILSEFLRFSFFSIPLILGVIFYFVFVKNDKELNSELFNN